MIKLKITAKILSESIKLLKSSSKREKVILWLGENKEDIFFADEVYVPEQVTDVDYFHIPEESMKALMDKIRKSGKILVAQVHTHPRHAFHSHADDKWAILRHENAYSIVVPFFCKRITTSNFFIKAVTFVLTLDNKWQHVDNSNIIIL